MLSSFIIQRRPDSIVWSWPGRDVSAAEIAVLRCHLPADLYNQSISLELSDPRALAVALTLLDGFANKILLLPHDLDPEVKEEFVRAAGAGRILSDAAYFLNLTALNPKGANRGAIATRWLICTSGTTGKPKVVEHTRPSLTRTLKTDQSKGSEITWGLLYDLNRFAGLQLFLQSLAGGSRLLIPERISDLPSALTFFSANGCNAISATPTLWRKILMVPESERLNLTQITLGGEIADQRVLNAVKQRWPSARIVHIYASTEAGVGFSVNDGLAGFPAGWLRQPPPGLSLRVDENGILFLKPQIVEQRFMDGASLVTPDGFINTGDLVRSEGSRVYFLGRESGAINVGGLKVHPEEVERVLLEFPGVVAAHVGAKKSAFTGALVKAQIVLSTAADDSVVAQIQEHCRARLEAFKVPALIEIVSQLQTNTMGKVKRGS